MYRVYAAERRVALVLGAVPADEEPAVADESRTRQIDAAIVGAGVNLLIGATTRVRQS
jgi:hypothetical protein